MEIEENYDDITFGDIFSNNKISKKYNESRNTPEFLEHLSNMVKEKQWSGENGSIRREEFSKKLKKIILQENIIFLDAKKEIFIFLGI